MIIIVVVLLFLLVIFKTGGNEHFIVYKVKKCIYDKCVCVKMNYQIECIKQKKIISFIPEFKDHLALKGEIKYYVPITITEMIQTRGIFNDQTIKNLVYQNLENLTSKNFKKNRFEFTNYIRRYFACNLSCLHRKSFIRFVLGLSTSGDIDLVCDKNYINRLNGLSNEIDMITLDTEAKLAHFYSLPAKDVDLSNKVHYYYETSFKDQNHWYFLGLKLSSLEDFVKIYQYRSSVGSIADLIALSLTGYKVDINVHLAIKNRNNVCFNYPKAKCEKKIRNRLRRFYNTDMDVGKYVKLDPVNDLRVNFNLNPEHTNICYKSDQFKKGINYVVNGDIPVGEYVEFKKEAFSLITLLNHENKVLLVQIHDIDYYQNGIVSEIFTLKSLKKYKPKIASLYGFNVLIQFVKD